MGIQGYIWLLLYEVEIVYIILYMDSSRLWLAATRETSTTGQELHIYSSIRLCDERHGLLSSGDSSHSHEDKQ